MTIPTQAQIEAAAKAMDAVWCEWHRINHGPTMMTNILMGKMVEAALAVAAAQVKEPRDLSGEFKTTLREQAEMDALTIKITIERCAQVAETFNWENRLSPGTSLAFEIAAAIRKLKDTP